MKIAEFISEWEKSEPDAVFVTYKLQTLLQRGVSRELSSALSEFGLPESAAPYLNFESMEDMSFLFGDYYYLGFTGNGDWICLNSRNGKILIVDHEIYGDEDYEGEEESGDENEEDVWEDEDFEGICLLNTSLEKLCDCLLAYKNFVQDTLSDDVEHDRKEYEKLVLQLERSLTEIDEKAMEEDGFWAVEVCSLCEDI